MQSLRFLTVLSIFLVTSLSWGQDVPSGPDRGKQVPPLKVFDATGPNKDKELDYVAERKQKPTIYLFIQADKWDRPMARFVRKLDEALQKADDDSVVVAVWLTDNPDKAKEYLPIAQQSLQLQKTILTCFPEEKAGPKDWNINVDAHLTAVVTTKGKVASVFGYRSINETDVPAVHDALQKVLKKQ